MVAMAKFFKKNFTLITFQPFFKLRPEGGACVCVCEEEKNKKNQQRWRAFGYLCLSMAALTCMKTKMNVA